MDLAELPQTITQDLFPAIYKLDVLPVVIDPSLDTYPFPYRNNDMPNSLTFARDPRFVTSIQQHQYRYLNENGVDVVIRGLYDDVMAVVDVLKVYPPKKNISTGKKYVDILTGLPIGQKRPSSVPDVAVLTQDQGKYLVVKMNSKMYSGSGALLMVVQKGAPLTDAKFVLFEGINTSQYQDLGGKIDRPSNGASIDSSILFENAKKEVLEESMGLFSLTSASPNFVDVESEDTGYHYRVFLYVFEIDRLDKLSTYYNENRSEVFKNYAQFNESYRETSSLDLFDYQTFVAKLKNYTYGNYNVSGGVFQTMGGNNVSVRGRTMNVVNALSTNGVFNSVLNSGQVSSPVITLKNMGSSPLNKIILA